MRAAIPTGLFPHDDIRFHYALAGGALMDIGHYALSALRTVLGTEPTFVVAATPRLVPQGFDTRCDVAMRATYAFANDVTGKISVDLGAKGGYWFSWLTSGWPRLVDLPPWLCVKLKEKENESDNGMTNSTQRTILMNNFMGPHVWHRIDITTTSTSRDSAGKITKQEKRTESKKAYTWPKKSEHEVKGEEWWPTYRYMLEEFVNKVKGRESSGIWIDGEESIKQAEATDRTYEKAGMEVRPSCEALGR